MALLLQPATAEGGAGEAAVLRQNGVSFYNLRDGRAVWAWNPSDGCDDDGEGRGRSRHGGRET
jgi:hypothetical protein